MPSQRMQTVISFPRKRKWEYATRRNVTVSTYGIPKEFQAAFLRILVTTTACYRRLFGGHTVGRIEFNVRKSSGLPLRLWTNGADRIYMTLSRKEQLQPPRSSGVRHIHGLTHEVAHIVMYRMLINLSALGSGWGEGWAVFCASNWGVPEIHRQIGPTAWPYEWNYLSTDGPACLLRRLGNGRKQTTDPVTGVVRRLWNWRNRVGDQQAATFFRDVLRQPVPADQFTEMVLAETERDARVVTQ